MEKIFLKSGELLFTKKPMMTTTILGSCISVTMFHAKTHVSAMCHALLPICPKGTICDPASCESPFKYTRCVIREMLNKYKSMDIFESDIEVKLFGGASNFERSTYDSTSKSVGEQNVIMAVDALTQKKIKIKVADVRGEMGRKIIFNTLTGEVWMKHIRKMAVKEDISTNAPSKGVVVWNVRSLKDLNLSLL